MSPRARVDRRAFYALWRRPTFSPTDCPNYLTYADYSQYRWYARLLAPWLLVTGGGAPLFVGRCEETLIGERLCDTWMIVRYPTHRRMLAMIASPYYALVNRFRERGTARLELGFTQSRGGDDGWRSMPHVLGVHMRGDDEALLGAVRTAAERVGLTVGYESRLRYDLDFVRSPRPNDPNPLTYPITAAIGARSPEPLVALASSLRAALAGADAVCAQRYARLDALDNLRFDGASRAARIRTRAAYAPRWTTRRRRRSSRRRGAPRSERRSST